jgi:hypothetical protein
MTVPTRLLAPLLLLIAAAAAVLADGRLLVSGGGRLLPGDAGGTVLRLPSEAAAAEGCKMTYGFLPCTDTALGNLFLVLAYGFLMFKSATHLSAGSELLLEILGPGIVGGLFLPILGALPDAMLILGTFLIHPSYLSFSPAVLGTFLIHPSYLSSSPAAGERFLTGVVKRFVTAYLVVVGACSAQIEKKFTFVRFENPKGRIPHCLVGVTVEPCT